MLTSLDVLWEHVRRHAPRDYDPIAHPTPLPPRLVRSAFDSEIFTLDQVFEVVDALQAEYENADCPYLRVYINGMESPSHEFRFLKTRRKPGEDLKAWLLRALASEQFGVVVNGAEQWSEALVERFRRIFLPLIELWPIPAINLEITFFIGNYGYTPFGVHIDDPYSDVYHFHLGPSTKLMTLFTRRHFHEVTGNNERWFEPESIISHGVTYEIEARDVFLLPAHFYHVGYTPEFSVGIAIAVGRYPREMVVRQAISEARDCLQTLAVGKDTDPNAALRPICEWLRDAEQKHVAAARSRGGFRYPPRICRPSVCLNSIIEWNTLFPLEKVRTETDLFCFIRGHRLSFANHPSIDACLDALVRSGPISASAMLAKFNDEIESEAILTILREVERCRGLRVRADVSV